MNRKMRLFVFDEMRKVAGVGKIRAFGAGGGAVAAQRQHVPHADGIQLVQHRSGGGFVIAHADQVRQGGNVQLVLDKIRHVHGGNTARRAARTEGDADKIRVQLLHGGQGGFHFVHLGGLLRGKALDGKNTALSLKHLGNGHSVLPALRRLLVGNLPLQRPNSRCCR